MPYVLTFNMSNVVQGTNNATYTYNFPSNVVFKKGDKIALQNLNMFFSWVNISTANNNNTFQYVWYNAVGSSTHTVTMPDGYYTIANINSYLQSQLVANGHYLVDGSGNYVYYLEIVANSVYYSVQLNSFPIPTALPAGYTNPAGITFPAVATTPQFIIPATNIRTIFGLTAGTYPAVVQATAFSQLSTSVPQIDTVSSIYLTCSLLNNTMSLPTNVLYNFSSGTTAYGGQISLIPYWPLWIDMKDGSYSSISISFLDQNFNFLKILDSNLTVSLVVDIFKGE